MKGKYMDIKLVDQKTGDVMEHECEMLSGCCGIEEHEYIEGMCGGCNEMVYDFECSICERKDVYV